MRVGIESINIYGGQTYIDVKELAQVRGLDSDRFNNLLMESKSMPLNFEDVVSFGVNSAKPIIDELSKEEKDKIELLIVSSESGIDFGKSISNYIHHYLGLSPHCRTFEVKQACYAGSAAVQMAVNLVLSEVSPGAKALIISADLSRYDDIEKMEEIKEKLGYAEPSQGAASVAVLISDNPKILEFDQGAYGNYTYEVMDTCRPTAGLEAGDPDLSLLSYLDCLENSYKAYEKKVKEADFNEFFDYFAFHTPFGGMVKGAHRTMARQLKKFSPEKIEADFKERIEPSLKYCKRVGNIYSGTVFLALCGILDSVKIEEPKRIGIFSYGSGCCSEFYSGIVDSGSKDELAKREIEKKLNTRYKLSMEEYEKLIMESSRLKFGVKDFEIETTKFVDIYDKQFKGKGLLILKGIKEYHREYAWS